MIFPARNIHLWLIFQQAMFDYQGVNLKKNKKKNHQTKQTTNHYQEANLNQINNVLLVKIEGLVWYIIYHQTNLLLKGKQTPLLINQPMGIWDIYESNPH